MCYYTSVRVYVHLFVLVWDMECGMVSVLRGFTATRSRARAVGERDVAANLLYALRQHPLRDHPRLSPSEHKVARARLALRTRWWLGAQRPLPGISGTTFASSRAIRASCGTFKL